MSYLQELKDAHRRRRATMLDPAITVHDTGIDLKAKKPVKFRSLEERGQLPRVPLRVVPAITPPAPPAGPVKPTAPVKIVLKEPITPSAPRINANAIKMATASVMLHRGDYYLMTSGCRLMHAVRARQVSMFLCRCLLRGWINSLPQIGLAHGGRDHTTVHYAVQYILAHRDEWASAINLVLLNMRSDGHEVPDDQSQLTLPEGYRAK